MRLRDAYFRDVPNERELYDYGDRTDGQPVYLGHAAVGDTINDTHWVIFYFVYDVSGNISEKYSKEGAWSARASLFA